MSRHRNYRNRTFSYDEVEAEVERRIDADGTAYTREEFIGYYGGDAEWKRAPPEGTDMRTYTAPPEVGSTGASQSLFSYLKPAKNSPKTGAESAAPVPAPAPAPAAAAHNPLAALLAGNVRVTSTSKKTPGSRFSSTMAAVSTQGAVPVPSQKVMEVCFHPRHAVPSPILHPALPFLFYSRWCVVPDRSSTQTSPSRNRPEPRSHTTFQTRRQTT